MCWIRMTASQQTAAERLINVYDGRQLLLFGVDQFQSRLPEVALDQEQIQVGDAGLLIKPGLLKD